LAVDIFTFAVLSLFLVKLASRSAIWYKSLMVISSSHSGSWNKDSKSHRLLPPPFLRLSYLAWRVRRNFSCSSSEPLLRRLRWYYFSFFWG
jgi:hypothetical protein